VTRDALLPPSGTLAITPGMTSAAEHDASDDSVEGVCMGGEKYGLEWRSLSRGGGRGGVGGGRDRDLLVYEVCDLRYNPVVSGQL